jgi:hypothetical protein
MKYDSSKAVSTGMFDEAWLRLVIKMATRSVIWIEKTAALEMTGCLVFGIINFIEEKA